MSIVKNVILQKASMFCTVQSIMQEMIDRCYLARILIR